MIEELIELIQENSAFPIPQTVYGYSDNFSSPPFAFILNLKTVPTYDTGGMSFFVHTFDIYLTHDDFSLLQAMDTALSNFLVDYQVTPDTFGMLFEGSEVVQEDLYVYRKVQHWTCYE